MNDWDRNNLNFLLSANKDIMANWQLTATDDDFAYALELLRAAQAELELEALAALDSDQSLDCSQAREVLSKFAL